MPGAATRRPPWVFPVLLAFLVYLPTLGFDFVFDDKHLVVSNAFLREPWSALRAFAHPFWYGTPFWMSAYYRPVVVASLAVNGRLLGWGPAGFHLVSVALHAANTALLLTLALRLGLPRRAASLGAALFAVHPAASWAVASIVARVDSLAALFLLLAWHAALPVTSRPARVVPSTALGGALFLLALLCKESAVAFVVVPVLALRRLRGDTREDGWRRAQVAGAAGALAIYLGARAAARVPWTLAEELTNPLNNPLGHLPQPARLAAALELCGRYLLYLFAPVRFFDPHGYVAGFTTPSFLHPAVLASALLLVSWIGAVVVLWLRREPLAVPLGFALASFLPASNLLMPIGSLYAINFLYLPLVGISLSAARLAGRFLADDAAAPPRRCARDPLAWCAGIALALLSMQAIREASIWRDGTTLYSAFTRRFPNYPVGFTGLGTLRLDDGRPAEAIGPLRRALALDDRNFEAHLNLGVALALTGDDRERLEEALRETRSALSESPTLVQARINAAKILLSLDRPAEAETEAREGLRLVPAEPTLERQLAESLFREKRYAEAALAFKALVARDPSDANVRSPFVVSLIDSGDLAAARAETEKARTDFPTLAWFDFCLARVEAREGHKEEALRLLRSSIARDESTRDWIGRVHDFDALRPEREFESLLRTR